MYISRCIDLELIHALLSYGYGLPDDRQLLLAKKINGFETGWCLGATLQMLDDSNTVLCLA